MTSLGPVSAALEADLREQARQHGILVWLDKEGAYTAFADRLRDRGVTEAFPIPVRCLRGSYLELVLGLEGLEDGVAMTPLVVHVPGHTEDSISETPLFELYRAGRFNDAPVLIGTNSDEGALFAPPGGTTPAMFESLVRAAYGKHSDSVLAVYPHATNEEAAKAARDVFRDAIFAWPTWAWATLQSQRGTSKAYVYYFDHRNTQSPNGANHGAEIAYVFKTLGAQLGPLGLPAPPRPEDLAMSDLVSSYWVNFAKTGDPNGPGLPEWPAFTIATQNAMHFDPQSSARPLPNMTQLKALDGYFAWRREEARARK